MIKYINAFIILLVLMIFGYLIYSQFFRYVSDIPNFTYTEIKNTNTFTNHDILKNKETIIVYVSTECGSCESIISKINKNINPNNNYILITSEKQIKVSETFFEKFSLDPKVIVLNDKNNSFAKDFNLGISIVYPTVFVFDKKNKLIKNPNLNR
jgi:thiol-disulfide isomerase/thioredoxin